MRILVVGDVHWSTYSSIVRSRGKVYSTRLENLVKSVDWAESVGMSEHCDAVVYLGDFFDRETINSEEMTALRSVKWDDLYHVLLVGNHESGTADLEFSSTKALESQNFKVISSPEELYGAVFIPYETEDRRKPLADIVKSAFEGRSVGEKPIIVSHNDIKGIFYGPFESKEGFGLDEIEECSSLYINGHLHNGAWLNKDRTVLNLGNLTGQNFSEDAAKYEHHVAVLDTDTKAIEFIENPNAMNFYKIDVDSESDLKQLSSLKPNPVLSIRCAESLADEVRNAVSGAIAYRLVTYDDGNKAVGAATVQLATSDHLAQFRDFVIDNVGDSEVVKDELSEVLRQ